VSFLHRLHPEQIALAAFVLQFAGIAILLLVVDGVGDVLVIISMSALLLVAFIWWFQHRRVTKALHLMKGIIFLGLYFLL
jgi:hypothetical protein